MVGVSLAKGKGKIGKGSLAMRHAWGRRGRKERAQYGAQLEGMEMTRRLSEQSRKNSFIFLGGPRVFVQ